MNFDEQLIEAVKESEFLFNKRSKGYKNNKLKEKRWQDIAKELNISVETTKRRWRTIKDRYYRTKKEAPSGSAAILKKPYRLGLHLTFLDNCETANESTISNYNSVESAVNVCDDDSNDFIVFEEPSSNENTSVLESSNSGEISAKKQKRRLLDETEIANTNKQIISLIEKVSNEESHTKTKEDIFCESLAVQIKEAALPSESFRALQINIITLLDEEVRKLRRAYQ